MTTNDRLLKDIEDGEFEATNSVYEALAILSDGTMISGDFDCGIRGLDHNALTTETEGWDDLHNAGVIRLVPESGVALIAVGQELSDDQENLLNASEFQIEVY